MPPVAPVITNAPPVAARSPVASKNPPLVMTRPPPTVSPRPAPVPAPVPAPAPVPVPEQPVVHTEPALLERLGPITGVPVLVAADLTKLKLDHRAAFVLRFLDGMSTIDDVLDASGLPRVEALRILDDLRVAAVIKIR
jgi:hypothetical protein